MDIRDESGSAVVEFVILAIPLFLPIMIYLSAIYSSSTLQSDLNELARQSARAYVTSPSQDFEAARMAAVLNVFETNIMGPQGVKEIPNVTVTCQATPCLTPNARVEVTATIITAPSNLSGIFRFLATQGQTFIATDTQVVDAWR
jgi:Flp pilus assembly protein TadG